MSCPAGYSCRTTGPASDASSGHNNLMYRISQQFFTLGALYVNV